jgi:hypothetical protein
MASRKFTSHTYQPALTGWPAFVGMARVDAAAALITNQPRGY